MIDFNAAARQATRRAFRELLALLFLIAFAGSVLYLVSGCTSAAFDVQDDDSSGDDAQADDAQAAPETDRIDRAPHSDFLRQADAAAPLPDAAPTPDTATLDTRASTDAGDAGAIDTSSSDAADGGACRHACLIASSSGANLPLGSTTCTWDGECCSGSCYVVHPGTGERGVCVAPGGAAHWCGGTQEWCPEAVTLGIARCVP